MNTKQNIQLLARGESCCGCGACCNICPAGAITMNNDALGFAYPKIDEAKCTGCGACQKVCAFQNEKESHVPLETYAAVSGNTDILNSASGGAFASLAASVLQDGGTVYGASMALEDGVLTTRHIAVRRLEDLSLLQGSKYVQSALGSVYGDVKCDLKSRRPVLFSGTPCQVAGLKSFLGIDYENLLLCDIICHGVPSAQLFQDYIRCLEERLGGKVYRFSFRDKKNGWGMTAKAEYTDCRGKQRERPIPSAASSYYRMFLKSVTYRDSCYRCKYASSHRPGDITVGDYWGIREVHPELLEANGGPLSEEKGISCLIVNTVKGQQALGQYGGGLSLYPSSFEKAAKHNGQLMQPSRPHEKREAVLKLYLEKGYEAVDREFKRHAGISYYVEQIKCRIPLSVKVKLKSILNR